MVNFLVLGSVGFSQEIFANEVSIPDFNSINNCDILSMPTPLEELGTSIFPPGERIRSAELEPESPPCPTTDDTTIPNPVVEITNLNSIPFAEVWYVTDFDISISNFDGFVNEGLSFKIDTVGVNRPLVSESMNSDGVFEPGETWQFIIQDYFDPLGLSPALLGSLGIGADSFGDGISTGSIVALPRVSAVGGDIVPLDSTMVLVAGTQTTAAWMIPVIVSAIGIGIVIARKF